MKERELSLAKDIAIFGGAEIVAFLGTFIALGAKPESLATVILLAITNLPYGAFLTVAGGGLLHIIKEHHRAKTQTVSK